LLQKFEKTLRLVPVFETQQSDILVMTCPLMNGVEIKRWEELADLLGYSINYWDVSYHHGIANVNDLSWHGLAKYVVFPHFEWCNNQGWNIDYEDIRKQFDGRVFDKTGINRLNEQFQPAFLILDAKLDDVEWLVFDYAEPKMISEGQDFSSVDLKLPKSRITKQMTKKALKLSRTSSLEGLQEGIVHQRVISKNIQKRDPISVDFGTLQLFPSMITYEKNLFLLQDHVDLQSDFFIEEKGDQAIFSVSALKIMLALFEMISVEERLTALLAGRSGIPQGQFDDVEYNDRNVFGKVSKKYARLTVENLIFYSLVDSLLNEDSNVIKLLNFMAQVGVFENTERCRLIALSALKRSMQTLETSIFRRNMQEQKDSFNLLDGCLFTLLSYCHVEASEVSAYLKSVPVLEEVLTEEERPIRPVQAYKNTRVAFIEDWELETLKEKQMMISQRRNSEPMCLEEQNGNAVVSCVDQGEKQGIVLHPYPSCGDIGSF